MNTNKYIWSYLAQFFLEWKMLPTKVVEIKTHILCSIFFFENRAVYEITCKNIKKPGRSRMTIQRLCNYMLDAYGCRHTLTICNTYCFSTATMTARTRLNIAVSLHFLACYILDTTHSAGNLPTKSLPIVQWHTIIFIQNSFHEVHNRVAQQERSVLSILLNEFRLNLIDKFYIKSRSEAIWFRFVSVPNVRCSVCTKQETNCFLHNKKSIAQKQRVLRDMNCIPHHDIKIVFETV
jgi:hypothetical protein